jgi:predicted N-acetyltransferase YhbS
MPVVLRSATEADAKHVESLLAELGYPSKEADVRHRLRRSLDSDTSCFLVAQQASEVIGLVSAELVPYFPNGSTICRVTGLVVSTPHRGQGVGEKLVTGAADCARERHCSGIEITSAEHRLDAHRFYQRLGFSRTSFRFFHAL